VWRSRHITVTPALARLTALTFTCSGLPAKASCTFTPNPVAPGATPTDVALTITTTASMTSALEHSRVFYADWLGFSSMGLLGVVVIGARRRDRKASRRKSLILGVFSLLLLLMVADCGGRSSVTVPGTPSGVSTVTVTGSTTNFTHSTTLTLTVN
jgi:hypothetical protein